MSKQELRNFSDADLQVELDRRKKERQSSLHVSQLDPVGVWKVTTEGDCEGRTIQQLGVFKGHIVDIAAHLASRSYYSLKFEPGNQEKVTPIDGPKKVHIALDIKSGTWDMSNARRANEVRSMLSKESPKNNTFQVSDGQYYASVLLEVTPNKGNF